MNEHDSERMKGMLDSLGYVEVESRDHADLILFNTCSIRESADNRFIAHLGEAKRLKGEDPARVVGVGGCWAQSVKDEVFRRFPFVDVAFGPGQIHRLAEFLTSDSLTAQGYFEFEDVSGHLPMKRAREFQGWLQISQGCNCVCAYCIVPSTRGREVSRDPAEIVAEAERLAGRRRPRDHPARPERQQLWAGFAPGDRISFSELLARVDAVEGIERLRYTSPHPKDMREDVIRAHAELPSLCEHIHLPLQSGSSPVLKRMRRTYTRERYLDRVALIREHVPDCALTTDIIVGFPGESEADFEQTLEVVEEVGYDGAFTFVFSPRRGTEAAEFDDQVPHAGEARADGAAGGAGPAPRARAGGALRRPDDGGAGRGAKPHRPGQAPGAHPPQQDGQLRRHRRAGGAGRGGDRAAPPRPRSAARSGCSAEGVGAPRSRCGSVKVLALFGPTAVGKTGVAIEVAELLRERGEDPVAVNCDSIQVYRGLETLSGAATEEERARLEHRLLSFVEPSEEFSAGRYAELAHAEIDALLDRPAADRRRRHRPLPARGARRARPAPPGVPRDSRGGRARDRRARPGGPSRGARARAGRDGGPDRPQADRAAHRAGAGGDQPPPRRGRALDRGAASARPCWSA